MHVAAQALMLLWCASDLAAQLQLGAPSPPPRPGRWLRAPTAAAAPPALTVLVAVPWHRFTTIADYLGELQHRHGDHLLLQVLLADAPPDGAELPAGTYAIGVDDQQRSALLLRGDADAAAPVACAAVAGHVVWTGDVAAGLADVVAHALAGDLDAEQEARAVSERAQALGELAGGGGDRAPALAWLVEHAPRDGLAWALRYLWLQEQRGDPLAARALVPAAGKALVADSAPLGLFADLVLRSDPFDQAAAHELATALLPAATAAPGDLRLQFARLRALLRCGGDKEVARLLPRLQRAVAAQPFEALALAETLTEARSPKTFRAVAEQCVAVASRAAAASARAGGLSRLVFATRHKLAVRVGEPQTAAAIVAEYRASTAFPGDLNDDAWLLMTELSTRGRFDALALALCQVMRDQAGSDLLHSHQDTLALALYLNGFGDEAEGMEEMAVQGSQQQPDYVARLERYRRARPPAVPPAPK